MRDAGAGPRGKRPFDHRRGSVDEMLPLLVGCVAQQMESFETTTLVVSYWHDQRPASELGVVFRDRLKWFFAAIEERYSNAAHAVATVELSERRQPNVHVLIRGVRLRGPFVRNYWRNAGALDVSLEVVRHPMSIAPYIFKIPLLGLDAPPAARTEILAFARDLHCGCYGYRHGAFIDPDLIGGFENRARGVMRYAGREREKWIASKMPVDVTEALKRATPPSDEAIDEILKDLPL